MTVGEELNSSKEELDASMIKYPNPSNGEAPSIVLRNLNSKLATIRAINQTERLIAHRELSGLNALLATLVGDMVEVGSGNNEISQRLIVNNYSFS